MTQRLIPGIGYVDETGSAQRLIPGIGYVGESAGGGGGNTTITCSVGSAIATGVTAILSNSGTITCSVGNAAATGVAAIILTGGAQFITDPLSNNSGSLLLSTTCSYSWFPSGRIGSLGGLTPVEGTEVTHATDGRLRISLDAGDGLLVAAYRITDATDDEVFYQAGTAA